MSKIELDKTDRKILSVLQTDGRLSNQDVAERVNLSPSPCLRRIKRLEEAGVIRQYVALVDPDKIGLGLLAYVNVRLEKHSEVAGRARGAPRPPGAPPRPRFSLSVGVLPGGGGSQEHTPEPSSPHSRSPPALCFYKKKHPTT